MTIRSDKRRLNSSSRRATFEQLESRDLLDGSGLLDQIRSEWPDFSIPDVTPYEIPATDLSAANLRNAINAAMSSPGDDIIVLHTTQEHHTISFYSTSTAKEFEINVAGQGTLTIVSMGTVPLTINANNASRIFNFQGGTCQVGGLILTNGYANTNSSGIVSQCGYGGAIVNSGTLSLSQVTIENCSAGGLFNPTDGYLSAFSKGGGIYNTGILSLANSVLADNTALSSGCNKNNLTAYGMGGGIYNENGTIDIRDTKFLRNVAQAELAPYEVLLPGDVPETRYVQQEGIGGALYSSKGTVTISGGSFVENTAWNGGGLLANKCALTCSSRVLFEKNSAGLNGGAVLIQGQMASNEFTPSFDRCEFLGTVAKNSGGALAVRTAMIITNSIISGNDAGVNGGGIYFFGTYTSTVPWFKIEVVNCTITGNRSGVVSTGAGAGFYFSGKEGSNTFAKLYVANSIIINNKDMRSSTSSSDPNVALKEGKDEDCFVYSTLTSFDAGDKGRNNPEYNPEISPFRRDYNFDTQVHGDYQLDYTFDPLESNPAINHGDNYYLKLTANPDDFYGQARVYGNAVDIGACEYHPSVFDYAFPTDFTVQEGCSFLLQCEGVDTQGNAITQYYVDLNGDGIIDKSGSELWISWNELSFYHSGKGYIWLAMENSLGEISDLRQVAVNVNETLPSIDTMQSTFCRNQAVKLRISVSCCERSILQWTINWGDGSTPTQCNYVTRSLSVSHYYAPRTETKICSITLNLVDNNGHGGDISYYIGSYTIVGSRSTSVIPEEIVLLEPEIASVSESAFSV
ncbi:MAG: choice-of-anchor Q domain-containing protein, partial [Planctomycetia bacterium]|nr:choice-of-anchor Q domain-containing protein [Planctomycetia bacterium]